MEAVTERMTLPAQVEVYTVIGAAEALGVSVPTVYRWIRIGRLEPYRIGAHSTLISGSDVERLKTERETEKLAG